MIKIIGSKINPFVVKMEVPCTVQSAASNTVLTVLNKYSIHSYETELPKNELNWK